jgi:hypothetical protein
MVCGKGETYLPKTKVGFTICTLKKKGPVFLETKYIPNPVIN